jgi:hypothetical protein
MKLDHLAGFFFEVQIAGVFLRIFYVLSGRPNALKADELAV